MKRIPETIKKASNFIKRSDNKKCRLKTEETHSIYSYIKNDVETLKMRKTVCEKIPLTKNKSGSLCEKGIDVREENIGKVLSFIKGNSVEEERYSDFVCLRKLEKERKKSLFFNRVYKNVGNQLKGEKMNPKSMKKQSIKNVIYINDNLKVQGNTQRKKDIKEAMRNLKIIH